MMFAKRKSINILIFSTFLLFGCTVEGILENGDGSNELENTTSDSSITSISDLFDTKYFKDGALEHIFEGEVNQRNQAVGFHYDGFPTKKGNIVQGTETKPNASGVYEAEIEVNGVSKTSNGGKSTFFPKEWNAQQVVDAINEAYEAKTWINGNTYAGLTSEGMEISMYLDQKEKIISAFPVYEGG